MSQALNQSWHVGRAAGVCTGCGTALEAGVVCWAALGERRHAAVPLPLPEETRKKSKEKEEPEVVSPYERIDFCQGCWDGGKRSRADLDMFSFWKTIIPQPQQKKKLLVDDSVLVDLFSRMSQRNDPAETQFRFVLALILMRKRLLKYESTIYEGEGQTRREVWMMVLRGTEAPLQVINPHLTADQISEVSGQLSSILAEEI